MATINPAQYVREVIGEVKKVTWPTRKETTVTTIMVFIMVVLAAIFFMVVDLILSWGVKYVLGLGG
jgi:preprotein translocase subunit SecE